MTKHKFVVPNNHTLEEILGFANLLSGYSDSATEFVFDFQPTKGYATPFGMLYLGFAIRQFTQAHPEAKVSAIHCEKHGYVAHMGYFQCCGFDVGKLPGEAKGSDTYLPITILAVDELLRQARAEIREVGEIIEVRSRNLAEVLTHQADGPLVDMLTYTLREMIRNVVEHSQSEFIAYCAQYHPTKKQAELAILDTGIGIRATLSQNPYLQLNNDHEALNLAIMPGISGKMYKGVKKEKYNDWQNSGYGLFAVSRLCGHEGKFLICSGDSALSLKPDKKEHHDINFQGTALRLNLSSKNLGNIKSMLARIMKEGDEIAKSLQGVETNQASVASRMLASEFSKRK